MENTRQDGEDSGYVVDTTADDKRLILPARLRYDERVTYLSLDLSKTQDLLDTFESESGPYPWAREGHLGVMVRKLTRRHAKLLRQVRDHLIPGELCRGCHSDDETCIQCGGKGWLSSWETRHARELRDFEVEAMQEFRRTSRTETDHLDD